MLTTVRSAEPDARQKLEALTVDIRFRQWDPDSAMFA